MPGYPGWVHLSVTGLAGRAITAATVSDQMGATWNDPDPSGHFTLIVNDPTGSSSADLYFPPVRNETVSVAGVSTATDMTLRLTFSGDPNQYVTQFAGGPWNPALVAKSSTAIPKRSRPQPRLMSALEWTTGSTEYDTITLPANASWTLTQPLEINHSVEIMGQNATLTFAANWAPTGPGAIYLDPNTGYSTDRVINNQHLNIQFDTAPGFKNVRYDPENEQDAPHAVVNLNNINISPVVLTLSSVSITGPPAFDAIPSPPPDSFHSYAGEPATLLVLNQAAFGWTQSSGSITGSTFTGGPVTVAGGPWTITGNQDNGALANTFSTAAFSVGSPHDLTFENNTVA